MPLPKVAGVDEQGTFNEKLLGYIIDDLKLFTRMTGGPDIGLAPGDVDLQLIESIAPELRTLWAGLHGAFLQAYIRTAVGVALEEACVPLLGDSPRKQASKSAGTATFSRTTAAPAGGIPIAAGTVIGTAGDTLFTTDALVTIPAGGTSISAAITAAEAGAAGNVSASTITVIVSSVAGVDSVTNGSPTSGGTDRETDDALRARALSSPAVRGKGTPDAIRSLLLDLSGVTAATVLFNNEDDTTADDTFFDSNETGTASENIAATEKIAQVFTVGSAGEWVQDVKFKVTHGGSAPTVDVRIETVDGSDNPTGTLSSSHHAKTGVAPGNGTVTSVKFERPAFLVAGSYALVLVRTAGDFTLDGGTGGTANKVRTFNGTSWAADANIENGNVEIIGGIPPHSVQAYVLGGTDATIRQRLFDVVAAGIRTWGDVSGTLTDDSGNTQTVRFSRPTEVTIYFDVTITTNTSWDATNGPNAVRDAIIAYVGGTDTKGAIHAGLALGDDVLRTEVIAAIMGVAGVKDITTLKIDTVNPPVSTTGNIAIASTSLARSETAANIDVSA